MTAPRTTVARLRWHRGLTQRQLAELANISVKTVEKIEAGQSKGSPKTAILLAGALAVDVELIVTALVNDYGTVVAEPGTSPSGPSTTSEGGSGTVTSMREHNSLTSIGSGANGEQDGELTRAAGS